MSAGRCVADIRYQPGQVNEVLEFLKRTRSELRMLRKAYVYRDRVQVLDVNGDWFQVNGVGYPDAEVVPGLVVFRFDAPLFLANPRTLRDQIRRLASTDPPPIWIVVAAEPITDVDTTAADMLEDLDRAINAKGVSLVFAEMKDPVREKIERYELTRTIDPRHFFPTVEAAVEAFCRETGVAWAHADMGGARASEPVGERAYSPGARSKGEPE